VGAYLATNLSELVDWLERYTTLAWMGMAVVAALLLARFAFAAWRRKGR
jgi:hypothetical protein